MTEISSIKEGKNYEEYEKKLMLTFNIVRFLVQSNSIGFAWKFQGMDNFLRARISDYQNLHVKPLITYAPEIISLLVVHWDLY